MSQGQAVTSLITTHSVIAERKATRTKELMKSLSLWRIKSTIHSGQEAHEKMLNITNHQRNANRNYNEISPHTSQNGHIKKSTTNKCSRGCGEKGTLLHCWQESKLVQPLWRTVWRFLKKLKIELPYDATIPLLGIYPQKTIIQKDIYTQMFTAALFTISRTWKQPKCPSTDEWIKKMGYIQTMEYYSAIKKE